MKNGIIFWHYGKAITLALLMAAGAAPLHAAPDRTIPEYGEKTAGATPYYVYFMRESDGSFNYNATSVYTSKPEQYDYIWYENIVGEEVNASQEYDGSLVGLAENTYRNIGQTAALSISNVQVKAPHTIKGAFYDNAFGSIRISNSTLGSIEGFFTSSDNNVNQNNSAIYVENSSIQEISGTFLNHGKAKEGGAVIYSTGEQSEIKSIKGVFVSNRATSGTTSKGGAILNADGSTIRSISGEYYNNFGSKFGGAIANTAANIDGITASFIENCTADVRTKEVGYGGAIANMDGGKIEKISSTFSGNTASYGGAIANLGGGTIQAIEKCTFSGNNATYGAAISNSVQWGEDGNVIVSRIETISDSVFADNGSNAIWNDGAYIGSITGESRFTNTNGFAIFNKRAGSEDMGYAAVIGSITAYFSDNAKGDIKNLNSSIGSITGSTFIGTSATDKITTGIAIWNETSEIESISASSFTNYAGLYDDNQVYGAIVNYQGSRIEKIENSTFSSNYAASYGGAIYNNTYIPPKEGSETEKAAPVVKSYIGYISGTFTENGVLGFTENGVLGNKRTIMGGAISNMVSDIGTISAVFKKNQACKAGGAIHNSWDATISSISGGTYQENKVGGMADGSAGAMGGAIYNNGVINSVEGAIFIDNKAAYKSDEGDLYGYGGAIYNVGDIGEKSVNEKGEVTYSVESGITGKGVFKGNRATVSGGAIYNLNVIPTIEAESFEGNKTDWEHGGGGGAIYNDGSIYNILVSEFKDNEAGNDGGAIANADGKAIWTLIEVGSFEGNVSLHGSRGGGAIYNGIGSTIGNIVIDKAKNNVVGSEGSEENTSGGGVIANYGKMGDVTIKDAAENKSWRNNGGVILNWTSDTPNESAKIGYIIGDLFHDNFAFGSGGAIHNEGQGASIHSISVSEFRNNVSLSSGGAVRNYKGAKIVVEKLGSVFTGNYARNRAGALYYEGTLKTGILNMWNDDAYTEFTGNESYNDGGAIVIAEKDSYIGMVRAHFTENKAGIYRDLNPETGKWEEDRDTHPAVGNGGAILNGFRYIDVNINRETGKRDELDKWFTQHTPPDGKDDAGRDYYILRDEGSEIHAINSTFTGNTAGYSADGDAHPSDEALGSGGAICNGYIDNLVYPNELPFDFWVIAPGKIGEITGSSFKENAANYRGGAIYNARGSIGSIEYTQFEKNKAFRWDGYGFGGAIFNNKSSTIGSISSVEFLGNMAGGVGGAIYNETQGATIGDISESRFVENMAQGGNGGAIYNEGAIGRIIYTGDERRGDPTGGFLRNSAGAAGGAVYNAGTIESVERMDFVGNTASEKGVAFTNVGSTGQIASDATAGGREYDNTVLAGIVNSSFMNNKTADPTGKASALFRQGVAALYTEKDLALVAKDSAHVRFCGNVIGMDEKYEAEERESDIYVGARNGKAADFYMIAKSDSTIETWGEINGVEQGYTLRLRGFMERSTDGSVWKTHGEGRNKGGTVHLEGLVKRANVLLDDVTLYIGKVQENHRAIDTSKSGVMVYDDTLAHNQYGDLLDPDDVGFRGEGGDIASLPPVPELRQYSDVLRNSRLEARSGRVMTADTAIYNYHIGTISSNGRMSYDEGVGYYNTGAYAGQDNRGLYATWSIDIDLDALKADTFTTWYKEGDAAAQSRGYMTLSGCTIIAKKNPFNEVEDWVTWRPVPKDGTQAGDFEHHDHSQDDYAKRDDVFFGTYPEIEQYYDVQIQVINLVWMDQNGRADEAYIPEAWKTKDAPLQLDLGELKTQERESAYMESDDLLCEGIGYGTTKTYHDSIHIWGWRDNLAAWSELQEQGGEQGRYDKEFHIIGEHLLSRNIKRYHNEEMGADVLLQEKSLMIYGDDRTSNILNVGGFNLLSEVAQDQTLELRNLTIVGVGTGDQVDPERTTDSIWQKTQNDGKLILDTLVVDAEYTVVNDCEAIKRGSWGIYNIFTSTQRSDVDLEDWTKSEEGKSAPDAIHNVLRLQHGDTYITGTIEYNNVSNEEGAMTYLMVHDEADYRRSDGSTRFADPDGATGAFKRFYCNSLSMKEGHFSLINLNSQELKLRDLHIGNGSVHINSTTVDLEKEDMGRLWAYGQATYDGSGHIIVASMDALVVKPKDGASDAAHFIERDGKKGYEIPVRFVNKGVAASVIPFGKENDYADDSKSRSTNYLHAKEGELYWYEVDYSYETGYYYYRRWLDPSTGQSEFVPGVQVGAVAEAAGALGSMQQITDHSFEHADLFADSVYRAHQSRYYTVVNVAQSKGAVKGSAAEGGSCSGTVGFRGGMWVRPYASYEKLPLAGGPKVTNQLYGALVGGDSALREYRSGWASVFSAHAAYMGSTQKFSSYGSQVRIQQNGGAAGITETFYRNNFYTALTATLGTARGHASTSAGTENFQMLLGGVASRSGYNFSRGRYLIQPTLLLSYTMVNMADYTNAAGTRISSAPVHQLQLHPYVKCVMSTDSCWSPYLTLGYVHQVAGKTQFHANGVKLPEMSTDPYAEYSVGVQRTWADTYTIFGQATGRHGGRNGMEASVGLRWAW